MIDSMDLRSEQALRMSLSEMRHPFWSTHGAIVYRDFYEEEENHPPGRRVIDAGGLLGFGLSARQYALDFLADRVSNDSLLREHAVRLRDHFEVGSEEYRALLLLESYEGTPLKFRNPRTIAEGILFATRKGT